MAPRRSSLTRSGSSGSSALSNIEVADNTMDEDRSGRGSVSTPPTSLADAGSLGSSKEAAVENADEASPRRPKRTRSSVSTYNVKQLLDAQKHAASAASSRNASGLTGRTLVADHDDNEDSGTPFGDTVDKALDLDWTVPTGPTRRSTRQVQRRPSVKDKVKKMAGKIASVLGKRRRGQKEPDAEDEEGEEEEGGVPRWKKQLDTGVKGLLDEIDLDAEPGPPLPPAKKAKTSRKSALTVVAQPPAAPTPLARGPTTDKRMKKWQREGLYVGQGSNHNPAQHGGRRKLQKKRPGSAELDGANAGDDAAAKHQFLTLPMFDYLDKSHDFVIPYDIFAPTYRKGDAKPKDWHHLNRNRLVGEAKELWERAEKLPVSACVCQPPISPDEPGCDDQCLNRVMHYECNDDNCNLPSSECGNRPFAQLLTRMKKGGPYDIGVEVIKTDNRGFGVRSCRTFAPGQIIMEYTGEIISEGECQRRMRVDYKDNQCYYLMELERGLVIDGTKGSMARFINHSCEPNCEVRMVKVNGTPRMGVFAGEDGVATGEELTYDYNFDNFGKTRQVCHCGTPTCRGFLSKRLNTTEMKRAAKEEDDRKRKAAEEARRRAEHENRKKKAKTERGSSWRGWLPVDDPEVRERLKQEKLQKAETERNSARAQRLAARERRESLPTAAARPVVPRPDSKRRKTVTSEQMTVRRVSSESALDDREGPAETGPAPPPRKGRSRPISSSSKFTEQVSRPTSVHSTATIMRTTEISVTEVRKESVTQGISNLGGDADDKPSKRARAETKMRPLLDAAKSVGKVVKSGFVPNDKTAADKTGGKLRQSRLSFARLD